ncbi:MAG: hypothetical protein ACYTGS_08210 [Planctomycetota bacterium]|jgi:hypothetical protein
MTDESSAVEKPYKIVSIRRDSNGYRYVIAFESTNIIHGCRQGSLKAVTTAVEETVARLNERHLGKPDRAKLVLKKKTHKW